MIDFLHERFLYILGLVAALIIGVSAMPVYNATFPAAAPTMSDAQFQAIQSICNGINPISGNNTSPNRVPVTTSCGAAEFVLPGNPGACALIITTAYQDALDSGMPSSDDKTPNQVNQACGLPQTQSAADINPIGFGSSTD